MKKVVILGLGVSGKAAAALLLKEGHSVVAADKRWEEIRSDKEVASLIENGLRLGGEDLSLEGVVQLVLSPGIPMSHPTVQRAVAQGIEIIGEIELAFRRIQNRCIGITGSNGKTTTVLLTTHLLNFAGIKARALGNVGVGLSSYLLSPDPEEILVVELSSFQLESLRTGKLDLGVVLNLTPNHLDRHPSMEAYAEAKLSIQKVVKDGGKFWVSSQVARDFQSMIGVSEVFDRDAPLASISSVGYTQWGAAENILAAFAIAKEFGIAKNDLEEGLKTFRKPPHRIEWVAEISGVTYYNDSKSSNLHSVMHAVKQFSLPIVIIVGGTDKGSSYKPWIECFQGKVKKIIAYGAAAEKIEAELAKEFPFERKGPFREAVLAAQRAADEGEIVLLSPGCSSYDQFKSFEHRGDVFKAIVNEFAAMSRQNEEE